jgi:alkanesulfonate monooxygenase SsuD/methylene tetrahydromethanopterin reductase-like flavin-dependent oxidoreductase (luciferase family)
MIEGQEDVTWDQWRALADACEEHGVGALFRSDHYLSVEGRAERGSLDAWATLAALAAVTTTIELGTLVSPATFRHPSELAKAVATVDHVSGGRVTLGLGAGWNEREHEAYGFPFPPTRERTAILAEQLEIVHGLTRNDRFSFTGDHYRLVDAPGTPRPLPLIVGGKALSGTADPAARLADEYNTFGASLDELRERSRLLDEACARAGRDPATLRRSLMAPLVLGRDQRELEAAAGRIAARGGRARSDVLEGWPSTGFVGTPAEIVAKLREVEAAGWERVMLHLPHDDLATVELLGREVVPEVSG